MNPPKCNAEDYIQWLTASPKVVSCTEAAAPIGVRRLMTPTHVGSDASNRSLRSYGRKSRIWSSLTPATWLLMTQLSTNPTGHTIELVTPYWSGQHRAVVEGLNLITLVWTDGDLSILSTGLFLTKRTMERVRMTTCDRCSRRLGRLGLNLIVYFGSHGILPG